MKRLRISLILLVGCSLLANFPAPGARADQMMHEVEFGEFTQGVPGEVMAAFPMKLRVHSGDTIHFSNEAGTLPETGIHLVSLLPAETDLRQLYENEFRSPDGSWATFITDPDEQPAEAPAAWKLNNSHFFPSHPYCGHTEQDPCDFDGSGGILNGTMNSGAGIGLDSFLDFYVRITAAPGTTIWALCPWHPAIRVQIQVVDDSTELPPGQQAGQSIAQRMPAYERQALQLHKSYLNKRESERGPGGTRVWKAWPGLSRGPLFLVGMYPKVLPVGRGDSVRWVFPANEIHTVTFPLDLASQILWLTFQCDPDTDSGPAPDIEAAPAPPFCPGGPLQFEGDLAHEFPFEMGDGNFDGESDLETSGLISSGYPGLPKNPYLLRFPVGSGPEGYEYMCLVHPTMRGKVVVE